MVEKDTRRMPAALTTRLSFFILTFQLNLESTPVCHLYKKEPPTFCHNSRRSRSFSALHEGAAITSISRKACPSFLPRESHCLAPPPTSPKHMSKAQALTNLICHSWDDGYLLCACTAEPRKAEGHTDFFSFIYLFFKNINSFILIGG